MIETHKVRKITLYFAKENLTYFLLAQETKTSGKVQPDSLMTGNLLTGLEI